MKISNFCSEFKANPLEKILNLCQLKMQKCLLNKNIFFSREGGGEIDRKNRQFHYHEKNGSMKNKNSTLHL